MSYPDSYDSLPNVSSGDVITASQVNLQIDAINAIESTLGLEPAGPYSTVADAIAGKLDANYGDDSGAANAYAVTLGTTLSAYEAGLMVVFKAVNANSGASTLNVNSLGAVSLLKEGALSLEAGDIAAGQIVQVVYDGSSFQLTNTLQVSPTYAGQASIDTVGTVTSGTWQAGTLDVAHGGTGAATATDAFNALSPMTNVGDLIYGAASGQGYRLPGNISATKQFLTSTGTGGVASAPTWDTISASDLPTLDQIPEPTSSISFNSERITDLADPVAQTDAATAQSVQRGGLIYAADSGSANTYAISLSPVPSSYGSGMSLVFNAANANSGASTLNVNGLGARPIKKLNSMALAAGDILAGQLVSVTYDGTNFQMQSVPSSLTAPMTDVGDTIYGGSGGAATRLAGNTSTTRKFLREVGDGSSAAAPAWDTLQVGDVPTLDHLKISDFDTQVRTSRLDQMAAPSANVSMNSKNLTSVSDPVNAQDAATRNFVDSLTFKPAVRLATRAALSSYTVSGSVLTATANGVLSIDSTNVSASDRVLVQSESSSQYNGIYTVTQAGDGSHPWILTRASDMSSSSQVAGAAVYVREGGTGGSGGSAYRLFVTTGIDSSFTLNTTGMSWSDVVSVHAISTWAVRVATTTTLASYTSPSSNTLTASANGALTIDGISLASGDRVLVKNETGGNQKYNGVYKVTAAGSGGSAWSMSRAVDMNSGFKIQGSFFYVIEGTSNAATLWGNSNTGSFTLNTTGMTWTQLGGLPQGTVDVNSKRVINVGTPTAASDAVSVTVLQSSQTQYVAGGGSTNAYTASLSPAPPSLVSGLLLYVKIPASSTNTGACTLNVNSLGTVSIKTQAGADPASGALVSGGVYALLYDGTNFQLL